MAIIATEAVDRIVKGGHQVRALRRGPDSPGVEETAVDRWTRVRQDTDQTSGVISKTVTVLSTGTGVPPSPPADRVEIEHYGQKRAG